VHTQTLGPACHEISFCSPTRGGRLRRQSPARHCHCGLLGRAQRTYPLSNLTGLLTFVDDVYVFGHLRKGDIVGSGSHVLCTAGDEGAAKHEVSRIVLAARKAMGTSRRHIPINILHITASRDNCEGSAIQANIGRIQAKHTKTH